MPRPFRTVSYEMKKLGTYLKTLREEAGFSIREAAQKSEIAPSYLSKIEAGDTFSTITVQTLIKRNNALIKLYMYLLQMLDYPRYFLSLFRYFTQFIRIFY